MRVEEVLTTHTEGLAPLRRPVMLIALTGWFDASGAATGALEWLLRDRVAPVVATIDPDPFYDFTQERPEIWLDDDETSIIRWPSNEFRIVRNPAGAHDLVVLSGVEPHVRWSVYCDCIKTFAAHIGCDIVVTIGANADAVPHTRTPPVFGSSTNDELIQRLGLSRPQYQGVTGTIGALHEQLEQAAIPAISLRVGVPHYLGNAQHPKSSAALLEHLEHILGVPTGHTELAGEIDRWQSLHDEAVAEDPQARAYVVMLERQFDLHAEAMMPTGDDLAAELESFLRTREDGEGAPGDDDAGPSGAV
jgi:proteasome assembly chaperone (PAC2) family protein